MDLVGGDWNMTGSFSHSVENGIIIPIDELIFFQIIVGVRVVNLESRLRFVDPLRQITAIGPH